MAPSRSRPPQLFNSRHAQKAMDAFPKRHSRAGGEAYALGPHLTPFFYDKHFRNAKTRNTTSALPALPPVYFKFQSNQFYSFLPS